MANIDNIELRSEKTQQTLSVIPSFLVRYGTLMISVIIFSLLAVTYFIPYPDNLQVSAMIINTDDKVQIRAFVPYLYVNTIYEGMNANIEFEGYPSFNYGYTTTVVSSIDKEVYNVNGKNFFTVYMDIQHNNGIVLFPGMNGTANITVSKKSFLHKMLKL